MVKSYSISNSIDNSVNPRRWLNVAQAAAYLNCSVAFLNKDRLTKMHGIPFTRLGRSVKYDVRDLDAYLEIGKEVGRAG